MNTILSPLIRLMNQYSFRVKFIAIGIIFIVPLIFSNFMLWSQLNKNISFAKQERVGVKFLPVIRKLAADMAGHRGTTQGLMKGDNSFKAKVDARKNAVNQHFQDLIAISNELADKIDSRNTPNSLQQQWQQLLGNSSLSAKDNFSAHTELIAQVLAFKIYIAQQSNLILDSELDSYYLMDAIVNQLPLLAETMGQVRGMGAGAIAQKNITDSTALRLSVLNDRLTLALSQLDNAMSTAYQENTTLNTSLSADGSKAVSATEQFIKLTQQQLLSSGDITIAAGQYFDAGTAAIAACLTLYDQALPELDRLLAERITQDEGNLTLILVIFTVILLLLFSIFIALYKALGNSINHLREVAIRLAEGDLTHRSKLHVKDELGEISEALNRIANDFGRSVFNIKASSDQLDNLCHTMYDTNELTCNGVLRQEADVNSAATSINEMTVSVQEVSTNTTQAAEAAGQAKETAEQGLNVVTKVVKSIEKLAVEVESASNVIGKLEQDSNDITNILDVIRGIADQTNLLALNAAIEAARAGDQGRGFAVVADEVRTLAKRTQDSTIEIQEMIGKLQAGTQEATKVMETGATYARKSVEQASGAGSALEEIVNGVNLINDMNTQIATAAEQQGAVAEEINRNIMNVKDTSAQTAIDAGQSRQSSSKVRTLSAEVKAMANRFIVDAEQIEQGWVPPKKLFEWDKSFSVDIYELDRQHQQLMTLANEYHRTHITKGARGAIGRVMTGVIDYTKSHFQYEESLMEVNEYPDLVAHKAQHKKIVEQVNGFMRRFNNGEDLHDEFSEFLKGWLLGHIKGTDQQYSAHLRSKGVE